MADESSLQNTARTLKRELKLLNLMARECTIIGYGAGPVGNNILHWEAHIFEPESTPFEGEVFFLSLIFPSNYHLEPPGVHFKTDIFHPNISRSEGVIALPLLKDMWNPGYRVCAILEAIQELMKTPRLRPGDLVLQPEAAEMYKNDFAMYEATARSWTEVHYMQ